MIQLDFISVAIGYLIGTFLCWSMCETLYKEDSDEG